MMQNHGCWGFLDKAPGSGRHMECQVTGNGLCDLPEELEDRGPPYCDDVAYIINAESAYIVESIQTAFKIIWREFCPSEIKP